MVFVLIHRFTWLPNHSPGIPCLICNHWANLPVMRLLRIGQGLRCKWPGHFGGNAYRCVVCQKTRGLKRAIIPSDIDRSMAYNRHQFASKEVSKCQFANYDFFSPSNFPRCTRERKIRRAETQTARVCGLFLLLFVLITGWTQVLFCARFCSFAFRNGCDYGSLLF